MNLEWFPDPSVLVELHTLNLAGNVGLIGRGRLPTELWSMSRLKELCIAPVGPLNCSETLDDDRYGRRGYDLAVKGVAPDPDEPSPGSLCFNGGCPAENVRQQLPANDGGGG